MYPSARNNTDETMALLSHFGKGDAELKTSTTHLTAWADTDLARDILSRRSTTSTVHTWGGLAFASQCVKQPDIAASTNDAEVRALFYAKRTLLYRSIL